MKKIELKKMTINCFNQLIENFSIPFKKRKSNNPIELQNQQEKNNTQITVSCESYENIDEEKKIALFLHSFNYPNKIKDDDKYPRYISLNYKINDPKKYHLKLIEKGYFELAQFDDIIKNMTKSQLIEILQRNNIKFNKQDKKDKLLSLIQNNLHEDKKQEICASENLYIISKKGASILENNFIFLQLYDNRDKWQISELEYNDMAKKIPQNSSFNDIIWAILNDHILMYIQNKKYGLARNTILTQAEFLEKENHIKTVIKFYIEVLLYDIYLEKILVKQLLKEEKNETLRKENFSFIIPFIVEKIQQYKIFYSQELAEQIYTCNPLPKIITIQKFKKIINDIINNTNYDCLKANKEMLNDFFTKSC